MCETNLNLTPRSAAAPVAVHPAIRVGCVSYLNAKPLIYGLEDDGAVQLSLDVPAKLIDGLRDHRFDVALLPVIDYQHLPGFNMLTAGGIGSDGPTLTVRIFSKMPVGQIRRLACDVESHTSVALARIVLAEAHGITPDFVDLTNEAENAAEARLLIGDKVVCDPPAGYPFGIDLGEAWKKMTGLPFVFAAWFVREGVEIGGLPKRLLESKLVGLASVEQIIHRDAIPRGWPPDLARKYLCEYLHYDIDRPQIQAIEHFYALAANHGLVSTPPRVLNLHHFGI